MIETIINFLEKCFGKKVFIQEETYNRVYSGRLFTCKNGEKMIKSSNSRFTLVNDDGTISNSIYKKWWRA